MKRMIEMVLALLVSATPVLAQSDQFAPATNRFWLEVSGGRAYIDADSGPAATFGLRLGHRAHLLTLQFGYLGRIAFAGELGEGAREHVSYSALLYGKKSETADGLLRSNVSVGPAIVGDSALDTTLGVIVDVQGAVAPVWMGAIGLHGVINLNTLAPAAALMISFQVGLVR